MIASMYYQRRTKWKGLDSRNASAPRLLLPRYLFHLLMGAISAAAYAMTREHALFLFWLPVRKRRAGRAFWPQARMTILPGPSLLKISFNIYSRFFHKRRLLLYISSLPD